MSKPVKSVDNLKKCLCMKCPSYTFACKMKNLPKNMGTMMMGNIDKKEDFEGLYCAFKKSDCIEDKKGCVCPTCEVYKENDLSTVYFCTTTNGE